MLAEIIDFANLLEQEGFYIKTSYEAIPERLVIFKVSEVDNNYNGEFLYLTSREEIADYFSEKPEHLEVIKNLHYYSDSISGNKAIGSMKGFATGSPFILRYPKDTKGWKEKIDKKVQNHYISSLVDEGMIAERVLKFLRSPNGVTKLKDIIDNVEPDTFIFIDVPGVDYKETYKKYLAKRIFIKSKGDFIKTGECPICKKKGVEVGVPDTFNIASDEKPFVKHIGTPFLFNVRICADCAISLYRFKKDFIENFKINILPIFIDETLRKAEVKLFKETEEKISFRNIMRELRDKNIFKGNQVNDFYLFIRNNNEDIVWVDYVPTFYIGNPNDKRDIFDIEDIIERAFFNGKLKRFYFEDLGNSKKKK